MQSVCLSCGWCLEPGHWLVTSNWWHCPHDDIIVMVLMATVLMMKMITVMRMIV